MDQLALLLKALADPARLRVLHLLSREGELCVCQIAAALELPYATLSRHLSLLKLNGLVLDSKRGRWVYYRLEQPQWQPHAADALTFLEHCFARLEADAGLRDDRERAARMRCCDLESLARLGPRALQGKPARTGAKALRKTNARAKAAPRPKQKTTTRGQK